MLAACTYSFSTARCIHNASPIESAKKEEKNPTAAFPSPVGRESAGDRVTRLFAWLRAPAHTQTVASHPSSQRDSTLSVKGAVLASSGSPRVYSGWHREPLRLQLKYLQSGYSAIQSMPSIEQQQKAGSSCDRCARAPNTHPGLCVRRLRMQFKLLLQPSLQKSVFHPGQISMVNIWWIAICKLLVVLLQYRIQCTSKIAIIIKLDKKIVWKLTGMPYYWLKVQVITKN